MDGFDNYSTIEVNINNLKDYEDKPLWFVTPDMVYHAKLMIAGEKEIVIQTYTTIDKKDLEGVFKEVPSTAGHCTR